MFGFREFVAVDAVDYWFWIRKLCDQRENWNFFAQKEQKQVLLIWKFSHDVFAGFLRKIWISSSLISKFKLCVFYHSQNSQIDSRCCKYGLFFFSSSSVFVYDDDSQNFEYEGRVYVYVVVEAAVGGGEEAPFEKILGCFQKFFKRREECGHSHLCGLRFFWEFLKNFKPWILKKEKE